MRVISTIRLDHALAIAIAIAVLVRLVAFAAAMAWPIPNENGEPVSPLLAPSYHDFRFYLRSLARYTTSWTAILDEFWDFYRSPFDQPAVSFLISGPAFPLLMRATGFDTGNYLPLNLIYLGFGTLTAILWLFWLRAQGLGGLWLALFAALPNPIWHTLVVSTDMLFATEFVVFFLAYFAKSSGRTRVLIWTVAFLLMLITRPNAFSVLAFVAGDAMWTFVRDRRLPPLRGAAVLFLWVFGTLYFYPYFLNEMTKAGNTLRYFGYTPFEYFAGIYESLPRALDLVASWIALIGAKALYIVGLRPSYGVTSTPFVLLRAAAGIVLLPGLIMLFVWAPGRIRLLVALYILPVVLGPTQDRYYLPLYPIWFLYGAMFWNRAFEAGRRAVRGYTGSAAGPS